MYYQGARSVSEQFFELDLATILDLPEHGDGQFVFNADDQRHWLKIFVLTFGRGAFLPTPSDSRTFHQRALDEGRFYEERVATNLSDLVFGQVFPDLAIAIANAALDAALDEVRDAALILLYRLLFILYAEDRDLLPVHDERYDDYGLREKVRGDIARRKDRGDVFSDTAARYWSTIDDLCRAIDQGDRSIGLPPYNGGLFERDRTSLLTHIRLGDAVMADVIDALSFERTEGGRKYINYRDLSVQQLGSIYERLLEHEIVHQDSGIAIRPNIFARKGSGSYYTPDDLVGLILRETLEPLVAERLDTFKALADELARSKENQSHRLEKLRGLDPAERLLELKICDPAMGSGHFLVSLVDYLADQVITAMAEAEAAVELAEHSSPLSERIERIRTTILTNVEERGWTINAEQLDDRHIIRRMVLKRCIYGVDKNPMAVELAKVSLWLHTFTAGAPLSFLDHHLRCGDSLFGTWVGAGIDRANAYGSPLLLHGPITKATSAAAGMQIIEGLTDAEIAEAHRSAEIFVDVKEATAPLDAFLSLVHALDWLNLKNKDDKAALHAFFDGQFGNPVEIARGKHKLDTTRAGSQRFSEILTRSHKLIAEERFLNWQVAFPGVWSNWDSAELTGGFDAVIGNPPWDRMKLQQVEWFAARRPDIAMAQRAADRKRMIASLEQADDALAHNFAKANTHAETAARIARSGGDFPLLSGGDTNLNSLFIERAATIAKPDGVVGMLVPSGIAKEMASQQFFEQLMNRDSVRCVFDFFNKRHNGQLFFPDVYYRFKFCAFVFSPSGRSFDGCRFATFVRDVRNLERDETTFTLSLEHIRQVNPNTRTTPVYRSRRDPEISAEIYGRVPILVNRSAGSEVKTWPIKYVRMFDMANDSNLFRTRQELEDLEGAYPIGGNLWRNPDGTWVPLYEGKMVQAFDHRAASIVIAEKNLHRSGQSRATKTSEHEDPVFLPEPRYYVFGNEASSTEIALKDVTSTTNTRSIIACLLPPYGAGHTLPVLSMDAGVEAKALLCANLNSIVCDFIARTKILSNHASWYIIEQLPVVPPKRYDAVRFGAKTAGEIVRACVLELTYTAHDMAPFARDIGYVNEAGAVKPPFRWDEDQRLKLSAKLNAIYFHLYGVTDRDDIRYIYSTFPILERQEMETFECYRSRDLCLAYINALAANDPGCVKTLTARRSAQQLNRDGDFDESMLL